MIDGEEGDGRADQIGSEWQQGWGRKLYFRTKCSFRERLPQGLGSLRSQFHRAPALNSPWHLVNSRTWIQETSKLVYRSSRCFPCTFRTPSMSMTRSYLESKRMRNDETLLCPNLEDCPNGIENAHEEYKAADYKLRIRKVEGHCDLRSSFVSATAGMGAGRRWQQQVCTKYEAKGFRKVGRRS